MRPSIDDLITHNINTAKQILAESGEVRPMFIVHSEEGFIPIQASFGDEEEKRMILNLVRLLMIKYRAYAYSNIFEAWMKSCKGPEKDFEGQVKDQPDKQEALIVSYIGYDTKKMMTCSITRKGDETIIGDPVTFDGQLSGTFMELLPPAELHAKALTDDQVNTLEMLIALVSQKYGLAAIELRPKQANVR